MKGVLYLVILLLFMNACDFHKDSSFPIEIVDASLNNIKEEVSVFADYSFIRLETLDTCLLENIVKVDIQGDAVYLLSSYGGKIYKFTGEGRYVWQLKQGNGPGELIFATDFFIDSLNHSVYVLDNYRELKVYSFDGEYMRTEPLPTLAFLFTKKEDSFLCFDPNLKKKSNFNFFVSQNGKIVMEGLRKRDGNRNVGYMPSNVFAFYSDDSVYVQHMLSDTIYFCSLSDKHVCPAYFIKTDGLSVNTYDIDFPDSRSFYQICKEKNYVSGLAGFSLYNNKIYLTMSHEGLPLYVIHDIDTGNSGVFTSLCAGLPNSFHCVGRNTSGIIYCYTMEELMEYASQSTFINKDLKNMIKKSKTEDNPVLIVFK